MNKQDLIKKITQLTHTRKDANDIMDLLLESMKSALRQGDRVVLSGFGSFYPKMRRAKKARHPKTGEMIIISPKKIVKFIPSPNLFE